LFMKPQSQTHHKLLGQVIYHGIRADVLSLNFVSIFHLSF